MIAILMVSLIALLWLLGVGVEAAWDWWRLRRMAAEVAYVPFQFELAYEAARQAFEETNPPPVTTRLSANGYLISFWWWPWRSAKECLEFYQSRDPLRPADSQQPKDKTMKTEIDIAEEATAKAGSARLTPINGKTYSMWGGIVDAKDKYIGGRLIEHDNHTGEAETVITDIRLAPNGTDSACICVDGEEWGMMSDVGYCGVGARDGNLQISSRFGTTWTLIEKPPTA